MSTSAWARQPILNSTINGNSSIDPVSAVDATTLPQSSPPTQQAPLSFKSIIEQEKSKRRVREEEEIDDDLQLALRLSLVDSQQQQQQQQPDTGTTPIDVESFNIPPDVDEGARDADYLMALQLQHQFEVEEQRRHEAHVRSRQHSSGFNKVQTVAPPMNEAMFAVNKLLSNESEEEEENETVSETTERERAGGRGRIEEMN
jgi:hypothetical protein